MASDEACPVLEPAVTENPGASLPVFTALSCATPAPGPAHGPPLVTTVVPPVLPAFPRTPLVAGQDGRGPHWTGASNVFGQITTEMGPVKAPQAQTSVQTQAPLVWQAPGAVCEGVACPPARPLAAAPVVPAMAAHIIGGTQACEGGWSQGLPPPAPPPAPQLAPTMAPGNACPWPQGAHGEGSQAPSQANAQPDHSCNPKSVYDDFQLWQRYKPLARRHLPHSPDTEALSCFFIPVLRSLAQQEPSMTLEEGLRWAMREWQYTSNLDRMIYYEMARKFLEFEAEEEMQIQKSQWMKGPQCLPSPALPRLEPQGPSAPGVAKEPVYLPSKAGPKAPPACLPPPSPQQPVETKAHLPPPRTQQPAETKAPEEIPPEMVQECVDIMEELMGPPAGATRELQGQRKEGEVEQEGDGMLLDPGILSYVNDLCSQKDFVTKVCLAPPYSLIQFLEELLSPDPQMDFLAVSQELEQDEGLTFAQVAEKRLQSSKEERCERVAPNHVTIQLDSISSKSAAGQGAERDVPGLQQGVSMETCPTQTAAQDPQGQGRVCIGVAKNPVVLLERLDSGRLRAAQTDSPPQDQRPTCPAVGTQDTWGLPGASPVKESRRLCKGSSEEERKIPGMVTVVGTNYRLRPWKLSQSPVPASGLLSPEGRKPQGALQSQSVKRRGLSPALAPTTKSKKRALFRGPSPAVQMPKGSSEEERKIPGMVTVVGTNYRLRPWKLSQSPVPASGRLSTEGRKPQGALQSQSVKGRGLSPAPAPATKSKKRALFRGPSSAVQTPKGSSEEEKKIPGMVTVVGTNYRLRPWKLSQSPVPASGRLSTEGWKPQEALRSQSVKGRGLSPAPAPATKSKKRALFRDPSSAVQMPHLRPGLRISGAQSLAWGLGNPSQSGKRKGDPLLPKRKKKQHRSQ
ncbi:NUT family member 2G-like [Callithrix jacchus]